MAVISVITVSYNTKDILRQCLMSVLASKVAPHELEVIVVDNASEDGSAAMIKAEFPTISLIENKENAGFAKANNQALEKAHGDFIFILNPDTLVAETAVMQLYTFCQTHPDASAVAPRLTFADGTLQPSCYKLPTIGGAIMEFFFCKAGAYLKYLPNATQPIKVEAVVGAAIFMPLTTIKTLGKLFDEKFYFYYEDIDLCRRIKAAGLAIYYIPDLVITHLHGASAKQRGSWAYEQNQRSAKIYFGQWNYQIVTFILKYGQKWQKLRKIIGIRHHV